jgi:hypothetical protein
VEREHDLGDDALEGRVEPLGKGLGLHRHDVCTWSMDMRRSSHEATVQDKDEPM